MKRDELLLVAVSGLILAGCLCWYSNADVQTQRDMALLFGSTSIGILAAVLTGFASRRIRVIEFKTKFPIEGVYNKYDNQKKLERHSGMPLKVIVKHDSDFIFSFMSEYVWGDGVKREVTGKVTFSDSQSGKGAGYYQYKTEDNNGTYEWLITDDEFKGLRIWIKYENFYPLLEESFGAYWIEKIKV